MMNDNNELNKEIKKEISKKTLKNNVKDSMCKIGLHRWKLKAMAKKNGKAIKIQKCNHCGLDRTK